MQLFDTITLSYFYVLAKTSKLFKIIPQMIAALGVKQ